MKKIVILGNPHSGTTILKSILGHIDEIYEIYKETPDVTSQMMEEAEKKNKKYILIKTPRLNPNNITHYLNNNFIIICIIRNPLYVISSIIRRTGGDPALKAVKNYIQSVETYSKYMNSYNDIYNIKYEDLFKNNYGLLKIILNKIGFIYNDNIFNNEYFINKQQNVEDKKIISIIQNKKKSIPKLIDNIEKELYNTNYYKKCIIDRIIYIESSLGIISKEINLKYRLDIICNELEINYNINNSIDDIDYQSLINTFNVTKYQHKLIRLYQINQPFKCMNDDSKININNDQLELLKNNKIVLELYPEISHYSCE